MRFAMICAICALLGDSDWTSNSLQKHAKRLGWGWRSSASVGKFWAGYWEV